MVDFYWHVDDVCAVILFASLVFVFKNIECRITNALFLLSVTLLNSKYCLVVSHNPFSQVAGFIPAGFTIFFITGGSESFHFFVLPE